MSAIGWCERFTGVDWERYANQGGFFAAITLCGLSILSSFLDYGMRIVLALLGAALFIAVIEIPQLFFFVPQFSVFRDFLLERLYFKSYIMRGAVYVVLSILCFQSGNHILAGGFVLLVTGIVNVFAHINRTADARDGAAAPAGGDTERMVPKSFGTF